MGNCQFDAQCFRLNILALDPASTRAPTKPCRIIRPTTFPKVCSTQLRSAQCMFKWFQWVWPRPGHIISKIFKSKTRKFMILYIFGCLKYLYHSDSGGGLPVSTYDGYGQIIFCDCSLSCSLLWLSPAVWVVGWVWTVDMQRAPAPRPQSQCWVQPTCQAASAQPTQHNITATNYKLSVIQGALQRLGEASPYLKNDVAILLRNQYQSSVKVLKIFPLPLLGWNQVSQKLRQ